MAVGWWYERLIIWGFIVEDKIEVNRTWQLLDGDKDVLLIEKDSFIISRFKGLIEDDLINKFNTEIYFANKNIPLIKRFTSISLGKTAIGLNQIIWTSQQEGIDAELLIVGAKGWEKGKVRIKSYIEIENNIVKAQVDIEFSPDEPPKPESPLDDLRELPEYKQ